MASVKEPYNDFIFAMYT